VDAHDGAEVYAYPHARGINAARTGVNIPRGIRQTTKNRNAHTRSRPGRESAAVHQVSFRRRGLR
jgi:hypothetical protein